MDNPIATVPPDVVPTGPASGPGYAKLTEVARGLRSRESKPAGPTSAGRDRPPPLSERCAVLVAEDSQWLHDHDTPTQSNITRAARLWQTSGLDEPEFYALLHEAKSKARAETKAKKRCSEHAGQYNRMPLYFAAIEQLIGLRDEYGAKRGEVGEG